jgi:hypothetical protein
VVYFSIIIYIFESCTILGEKKKNRTKNLEISEIVRIFAGERKRFPPAEMKE